MIKAEDLRIGNYLSIYGHHEIVESIGTYGCSFEGGFAKYTLPNLKPIPLTEEILLKCGFIKVREYFTIDNEFDIFKDKKGYYTHINCGNIYLNSLHQLQNIYYSLTQEELEIKL